MASTLSKGSMVLDGVAASEHIDSSGEQLDIKGLDISELEAGRGVLNFEHRGSKDDGASANDIIGAITYAHKIFSEKDCKNDRQKAYWEQVQTPFLYIQAELFDAEGHPGAVAAASLIRYYNRRKLPILMRYSIEGSVLERNGNKLTQCVAKKVAATISPCNRSCFSGVVSDKPAEDEESSESVSLDDLIRTEHPTRRLLGSHTLQIDPVIQDPVELLKSSLEGLKEASALSKAISAGGYGGSPESLSGGSALQAEDVSDGNKKHRPRALAALRDWDRKKPFREFLKSRMQDVSDSFIDHFVDLVDDFHLKKQEALEVDLLQSVDGRKEIPQAAIDRVKRLTEALHKAIPAPAKPQLAELKREAPEGAHKFQGQHVFPGEVEVTSGIYKGSKLHLLGQDAKHAYVKAKQTHPDGSHPVQSLPAGDLGKTYKVNSSPTSFVAPETVHAEEHGDPTHTQTDDQKFLMHGMNLKSPAQGVTSEAPGLTSISAPEQTGWFQSAHGKVGYVKPELPNDTWDWDRWDSPQEQRTFSVPEREALYHNLARDYFGMGAHVPTTALFTHPKTGQKMSVIERIPGGQHYDSDDDDAGFAVKQAGDNGSLDKLAIMDSVLGQYDRHAGNYMVTPQAPFVHHIDNGMIFNHNAPNGNESTQPSYLNHYYKNSDLRDYYTSMEDTPVHPHAAQWALGLNADDLHRRLLSAKAPAKFAQGSADKLRAMQQLFWQGQPTRGQMLNGVK